MNDSLSIEGLAQRMRDVRRARGKATPLNPTDFDTPSVFAEVAAAAQQELEQRLNLALVRANGV